MTSVCMYVHVGQSYARCFDQEVEILFSPSLGWLSGGDL